MIPKNWYLQQKVLKVLYQSAINKAYKFIEGVKSKTNQTVLR